MELELQAILIDLTQCLLEKLQEENVDSKAVQSIIRELANEVQ